MSEYTSIFIAFIKGFALEPKDLMADASRWLPLVELWIDFGEAMAFFESNDEEFSEEEAEIIRDLDKFIVTLPPEPDEHWHEKSLESPLWIETRRRVRQAIAQLEELDNGPHPEVK